MEGGEPEHAGNDDERTTRGAGSSPIVAIASAEHNERATDSGSSDEMKVGVMESYGARPHIGGEHETRCAVKSIASLLR